MDVSFDWTQRFTEVAPLRRLGEFHLYRARQEGEPCVVAVSQAYVDPAHAKALITATIETHEAFEHDTVPAVIDHGVSDDMAFVAFACAATHDLGHLLAGFADRAEALPPKVVSALINLLMEVLATRDPQAPPVRSISAANMVLAPDGRIWFLALGSDLLIHQGLGLPTAVVDHRLVDTPSVNATAAGLTYLHLGVPTPANKTARGSWTQIRNRLLRGNPPFADLEELQRALRVWWTEADIRPDTIELARIIADTLEPRVAVPAAGMMVGGRYRLEHRIGYGRRGTLFLGWDTVLEQSVALKWVDHQDKELLARLFREVGILRQIRHPNIVGGFDLVLEPGKRYVAVMEYVPGNTLAEAVARRTPTKELLGHLVDIADALDYLQHKGIVHRGIRPENIIISRRGAVLVDLAIARQLDQNHAQITHEHDRLGSFRYMAPEQTTNDRVTPATDIFAFGRILLELLSPGDRALLMEPRVILGWLRKSGVPEYFAQLVAQTMSFNPSERPSAAQLRAALRQDLNAGTALTLELTEDGATHIINNEKRSNNSKAARRLLIALAKGHGRGLMSINDLFRAGWPGQRASLRAQKNRVYVNLSILRKQGFSSLLERVEDGYRLVEDLRIIWLP